MRLFMRLLFSFLLLLISAVLAVLFGQTPFAIVNSDGKDDAGLEQISMANPWVGAKLSYNLNDEKPISDNFLFSAKVLYMPVASDKYAVPIVGSIGLNSENLFDPESGLNLGVYPWYKISANERIALIAHGGFAYKVITEGVDTGEDAPQQMRILGGLEAVFFSSASGLPTTISVTPVYLNNTNTDVSSGAILEVTGIIPIAKGLGLLADGVIPFKKDQKGSFALGVIVNNQL